jgi:N-acetylmuramoyl-L-alanine amidase
MKNRFKLLSVLGMVSIFLLVAFKPLNDKKVIVIDAAHGGKDSGATVGDVSEKDIVDKIAIKIKELNKSENIEIILLRESDDFIGLKERVEKINKINPDLLISLHVNNTSNVTANGVEAYVSKENKFLEESFKYANGLLDEVSAGKLNKRKVTEAKLYVLEGSNCPAVNLQLGFLSNKKDKKYLISESGQTEIATYIIKYFSK